MELFYLIGSPWKCEGASNSSDMPHTQGISNIHFIKVRFEIFTAGYMKLVVQIFVWLSYLRI